jgi:hypothetical protein
MEMRRGADGKVSFRHLDCLNDMFVVVYLSSTSSIEYGDLHNRFLRIKCFMSWVCCGDRFLGVLKGLAPPRDRAYGC